MISVSFNCSDTHGDKNHRTRFHSIAASRPRKIPKYSDAADVAALRRCGQRLRACPLMYEAGTARRIQRTARVTVITRLDPDCKFL